MGNEKVVITVYGAEQICASCVGAPGSKDTYEWLQAAVGRKYIDGDVDYTYININESQTKEKHAEFVERIFAEDLFYPIIFVNEEMVAEGIPRLKTIYQALDKHEVPLQS
ncbi:YuzD family protein [Virgibacillus necropolis]|uniref:Disulfide oxidoreductase n=1 Tax=Virgibacillus necropolis TaxID=163877 RepID=A0A221MB83_9BACI|nr:YuzD family protein [Virgibacillus necropolis]ASN04879.1 disulfide oxidoreductase [Virgibacillus necropolis]